MPFSTRNTYYLRISASTVLQLFVYLDASHVRWMNDRILMSVLEDLRTRIVQKINKEMYQDSKKEPQVDVHRGESYQFCYFLRPSFQRHVVLLKNKTFVDRPVPIDVDDEDDDVPTEQLSSRKRKRRAFTSSIREKEREKDRGPKVKVGAKAGGGTGSRWRTSTGNRIGDDDVEIEMNEDEDESPEMDEEDLAENMPPQSETYEDEPTIDTGLASSLPPQSPLAPTVTPPSELVPSNPTPVKPEPTDDDDIPIPIAPGLGNANEGPTPSRGNLGEISSLLAQIDEEKKFGRGDLKPVMQLTYNGFSIFGRQLVVVVEPWPALPANFSNINRRSTTRDIRTPDSQTPFPARDSSIDSEFKGPAGSRSRSTFSRIPAMPQSRAGGNSSRNARNETPLFRPATPAGSEYGDGSRSPSPWTGGSDWGSEYGQDERDSAYRRRGIDGGEDEDEERGMVAMSQALMCASVREDDLRVSDGEEDDEGGGGGDPDEEGKGE